MAFSELLTFSIHYSKENDKVMTKDPAPCLPSLSDLFYFEGRQFIGWLSFLFKVEFSPLVFSGRGQSSFPSQWGSSDPPGGGGEKEMRTVKSYP